MNNVDLSIEIAGIRLSNPLVLASGILGTSATLLERVARAGAGAVTSKSCGPVPRAGHPNPIILDWGSGLINAVGLTNPGAEAEVAILADAKRRLASMGVRLFASIFADTVENFARVAEIVSQAEPDLIEVNISCPNVASEFGEPFAASCPSAAAVTAAVKRATRIPVAVKLAPNVPDIAQIARAVVAAGADAITAINTMPGLVVDPESGQPILSNKTGGISGPALKPIALRCIAEIARTTDVPIIGTGGVLTGTDAAEMIMAGATAVGVGSAVYYRGIECFDLIRHELSDFMIAHGLSTIDELRRASFGLRVAGSEFRHPEPKTRTSKHISGLPQPARILAIRDENARTKTFVLDAHLDASPGQFVMAWLPRLDEKPFSLVDGDPATITVARVGPFTEALHRLQVGDKIWLRGPLGRGFELCGERLLLVGGGYGVAPLDFLARRALADSRHVVVAIGARTSSDLLFVERFRERGVEVLIATEDGSVGQRGLVTSVAEPVLECGRVDTLYACGPHGMLAALERLAGTYGVPAQLSWEAYMRCGIGLCGSCEHEGARLLCVDGPVLRSYGKDQPDSDFCSSLCT